MRVIAQSDVLLRLVLFDTHFPVLGALLMPQPHHNQLPEHRHHNQYDLG